MQTEAQKRAKRKYYLTKVKPFRKKKERIRAIELYKCPLCSKSSTYKSFENSNLKSRLGVMQFLGYRDIRYQNITNLNPNYQAKLIDFLKFISHNCCYFLNNCIQNNIISSEEVAKILGLVTPSGLNEIKSFLINKIIKLEDAISLANINQLGGIKQWETKKTYALSSMSGATVCSGRKLETPRYSQYPLKLKSVTPL